MSPERWQKVKELFHSALERDPGLRSAFLEEVCREDAALRADVESLLTSHEAEPDFIELPAAHIAGVPGLWGADALAGETLGPYRLERPIAYGGMGVVYLAARADEAYRKQVAVKVVRSDRFLDAPLRQEELRRRFRTERQTLASLDHPNIAKLLDGGTTDDGTPYLVMDYIEGKPIDEYCDARRLSTVERLQLFRAVCAGVHYAHQHLVIHRDLKPSNILVTSDGTPRLLDFGIAKLLEPDSGLSSDQTRTALQPMTPEYASPEHIRGERITTASDVYSLGVVLYELLTGHRPWAVSDVSRHDIARVICERQPDNPSTAVMRVEKRPTRDGSSWITLTPQSVSLTREGHPDQLRRRLAGDVDMIVLKALRKEPDRRYASVEQLSEDIRRHLTGLPVIARPDTLLYRASKFSRRHALGVAATAMIVLTLAATTAVAAWSAREAHRHQRTAEANLARALGAERKATAEAETAQQVADYLVKVFEVSDPFFSSIPGEKPGTEITASEILKQGKLRIEADLRDQPEIQARLFYTLGKVYANLGAYDEAQQHLERSLRMREEILGYEHPDVASTLHSLGQLFLAKGDYPRAETLMCDALVMRRRLLAEDDPQIAASLDGLGTLFTHVGDYAKAEDYYKQALDMYRSVLGPDHLYVAMSLANRATVLHSQGEYDAAEPVYREALELLHAVHGDEHPNVATVMVNLALLLQMLDKREEAETLLREALDLRLRLFGEEHETVAHALHSLGYVVSGRGDLDQARELYEQALVMRRKLLGAEHPAVAETMNDLAWLEYAKGRFAEAEPLFYEAQAIERKRYPEGHPSLALNLHNLASVFAAQGKYVKAEEMYREALSMRCRWLGDRNPATAETLHNLGGLLYVVGNLAEAEPLLREALEIRREVFADEHHAVAATRYSLGALLREKGEYGRAEELLRQSLETRQAIFPSGHPSIAQSMTALGILLTLTERPEEAEPLLLQALEIRRAHYGDHWLTANTTSALGACLAKLGEYEEAEPLLTEAFTALESARGVNDPFTLRALRRLIDLYDAWNEPDKAAEYRALLPTPTETPEAVGP